MAVNQGLDNQSCRLEAVNYPGFTHADIQGIVVIASPILFCSFTPICFDDLHLLYKGCGFTGDLHRNCHRYFVTVIVSPVI